jgi:glycosyltransferase involved in cell wall biosynthesis
MPTHNRRSLIHVALKCYLSQDWPDKELVVVDDGADIVRELVKQVVPDAVYIYLAEKQLIGTKRNLACEATSGEVICHFDDDDWSAAGRIRDQATRLLESGKQMTGYHSITYWNGIKACRYVSPVPQYAVGATMCYQKRFWETHRFPDKSYSEDNALVYAARDGEQLIVVDAGQMMIIRSDASSTSSPESLRQNTWPEVPRESLPREFFEAIAREDTHVLVKPPRLSKILCVTDLAA